MTRNSDTWVHILQHCQGEFKPITPLIGQAAPRTTLYRRKDELLRKGWLETDGKDQYRTTRQGLIELERIMGQAPEGLSRFYPPLALVPTPQHRAMIELTVAAVLARKYDIGTDRHPSMIVAGPTLTWKTSTGVFLCHMLGLDPAKQIVNLAAESGRSLWLRKTSTGKVVYRRELLNTPLAIFDEYQAADLECKRLLAIWTDGRKNMTLENQRRRTDRDAAGATGG